MKDRNIRFLRFNSIQPNQSSTPFSLSPTPPEMKKKKKRRKLKRKKVTPEKMFLCQCDHSQFGGSDRSHSFAFAAPSP